MSIPRGNKYLAIWLFGGLPVDVLIASIIILGVPALFYENPTSMTVDSSELTLRNFFALVVIPPLLFLLYSLLLRDRVIRLYLHRWL